MLLQALAQVWENLLQHDTSTRKHGGELHQRLPKLLAFVRAGLEKLWDDGDSPNIQESTGGEGQQHVSPLQTSAHDTSARAVDIRGRRTTAKLLDCNAYTGAEECADSCNKLRAHGCSLGEARLDEKGEVAYLVRNLVEEDSNSCGCADCRRGVEGGAERQAVGDIVGEVCNEVEVTTQPYAGIDLLLRCLWDG